jgi:hypothetical protein
LLHPWTVKDKRSAFAKNALRFAVTLFGLIPPLTL